MCDGACARVFAVSQLGAQNVWVSDIEYSPLLGGFAVVLSNGRPAFITATTLKFEPSVSLLCATALSLLFFVCRVAISKSP